MDDLLRFEVEQHRHELLEIECNFDLVKSLPLLEHLLQGPKFAVFHYQIKMFFITEKMLKFYYVRVFDARD